MVQNGPSKNEEWEQLTVEAVKAIRQQRFDEAEKKLVAALAIAEIFGEQDLRLATTLSHLGVVRRHQGRLRDVESLYVRAIVVQARVLGKEHPEIAKSLNNLGELYFMRGMVFSRMHTSSIQDFAFIDSSGLRALGAPPTVQAALTSALNSYGEKCLASAEQYYLWALAIQEKQLTADDPALIVTLSNLATLYGAIKKYDQAEPLHQRVLAIRERTLGPEHPDVATTLYKMGDMYRFKGDYASSESLYLRALAITEKTLGPNHISVAWILNGYAEVLRKTKRKKEAQAIESRAKAIEKQNASSRK